VKFLSEKREGGKEFGENDRKKRKRKHVTQGKT